MRLHRWCLIAGLLSLAASSAPQTCRAQDLTTKEFSAKVETVPVVLLEAMAELRPRASLFNLKEQRLDRHDREKEVKRPPAGTPPQAEVALPPETDVGIMVNGVSGGDGGILRLTLNRPFTSVATEARSVVSEPSAAITETGFLFATGNWFAGFATDAAGSTFVDKDPFTAFPRITGRSSVTFCCDQIVQYDAKNKALIWFLQYVTDASTGNVIRLGVETGNDISGRFRHFYTFEPKDLAAGEDWGPLWFDYPAMTLSGTNLYFSVNAFGPGEDRVLGNDDDEFKRAVLVRMPLSDLTQYHSFNGRRFTTTDFSLKPAYDGDTTLYAACHADTRTLRVYSWPEGANTLSKQDITVQEWTNNRGASQAPSPQPDGRDWLGRSDPRVVAGWSAKAANNAYVGFGWNAAQDQLFGGKFPFPHVRVALLKRGAGDKLSLAAQPHIWNPDFAFAYPAAAANTAGQVGISLSFGGGTEFPSHAVGVLLPPTDQASWRWKLAAVDRGTNGPDRNSWGDYLSCLSTGSDWVATGMTLHGGSARDNMLTRVVRFRLDPRTTIAAESMSAPGAVTQEVQALRSDVEQLKKEIAELRQRIK